MGPIWGRQDLVGPHDGPKNFAIWGTTKGIHHGLAFSDARRHLLDHLITPPKSWRFYSALPSGIVGYVISLDTQRTLLAWVNVFCVEIWHAFVWTVLFEQAWRLGNFFRSLFSFMYNAVLFHIHSYDHLYIASMMYFVMIRNIVLTIWWCVYCD